MASRVVKLLYIEPGTDEKSSSIKLERATRMLDCICVFTVVSNPFTGLECTEHTHYDAIFIANTTACQINALDFLRILRQVGAATPVILMVTSDELQTVYASDYGTFFSSVLLKPLTERSLCQTIFHVMHDSLADLPLPPVNTSLGVASSSNLKLEDHLHSRYRLSDDYYGSVGSVSSAANLFTPPRPPTSNYFSDAYVAQVTRVTASSIGHNTPQSYATSSSSVAPYSSSSVSRSRCESDDSATSATSDTGPRKRVQLNRDNAQLHLDFDMDVFV